MGSTAKNAVAVTAAGFLAFVGTSEGLRTGTYKDPVGIPTICYGHTGPEVRMGQVKTKEQCGILLTEDILKHRDQMFKHVKVPLNPGEEQAYTDFVFNLGEGNWRSSTMLKKLNAGDRAGACAELKKWNKATIMGKKVALPGLTIRRDKDYKLCTGQWVLV